ncbi:MAG: aldo/keto reductase [Candidatus Promineifilaceae bacterium]|nr:aldo/keto reductase [Candidatus Promineifilaceae bacterium]
MNVHELGTSGLTVSAIGLGLAALGRPGYINLGHAVDLDERYALSAMEARTHAVLDAAWSAGVRYFDAARSYGRAESFLASWLHAREIPPEQVTVGSKWGYIYTAGWQVDADVHEVKEHSLALLRRQHGESVARLGPHLDLYQIHSATLSSGVLENDPVLNQLARLRSAGLRIGLSLSGERQADTLYRALEIRRDGRLLFDSVQATWNLLERSAGDALREASAAGMGVIVKEALANGRLTPRNDIPAFASQMALLQRLAEAHNTTVDALALAAVLAQPWADVVLSGAATVQHLQANLGAERLHLGGRTFAELDALIEAPAAYWQTRSNLPWN